MTPRVDQPRRDALPAPTSSVSGPHQGPHSAAFRTLEEPTLPESPPAVIRKRPIVLGLSFVAFGIATLAWAFAQEQQAPLLPHGINLAGAEFGSSKPGFCNLLPGQYGKDYTYNSEKTIAYFAQRGLRKVRLPVRWERLQPHLGEPLDAEELDRLKVTLDRCHMNSCEVILDLHNYGRYRAHLGKTGVVECVIDRSINGQKPVSREHFADFWRRLVDSLRDKPALVGYGLMNEPHDMGQSNWKDISQAAVDAIRATGDKKWIYVGGDGWSNAHRFAEVNGPTAWIKDPLQKTAYEAHCYFDRDFSGQYKQSYEEELAQDPELAARPERRLRPFVNWCKENKVPGILGEIGVPADDERWLGLLKQGLKVMKDEGIPAYYWAAGEWWGNYPLSIQPHKHFSEPASQMKAMLEQ